jgi:hypothetical protein
MTDPSRPAPTTSGLSRPGSGVGDNKLLWEFLSEQDEAHAVRARRWLNELGADAVGPLSGLLALGDRKADQFAAEWLGRVGDERAVGPLRAALARYQGDSPKARTAMERGILGGTALGLIVPWAVAQSVTLIFGQSGHFPLGPLLPLLLAIVCLGLRSERGGSAVIIRALGQIAERHPGGEVRQLAGEFDAIRSSRLLQPPAVRRAAREAAARIRASGDLARSAPVPAAAPAPNGASLPVPTGELESG